jgi:hypothetical protein
MPAEIVFNMQQAMVRTAIVILRISSSSVAEERFPSMPPCKDQCTSSVHPVNAPAQQDPGVLISLYG